jgi:hypothetical protein
MFCIQIQIYISIFKPFFFTKAKILLKHQTLGNLQRYCFFFFGDHIKST